MLPSHSVTSEKESNTPYVWPRNVPPRSTIPISSLEAVLRLPDDKPQQLRRRLWGGWWFCRLEFLEQDQGSALETYRGELATMEQRLFNKQVRAASVCLVAPRLRLERRAPLTK
jgi:hypothetical protein